MSEKTDIAHLVSQVIMQRLEDKLRPDYAGQVMTVWILPDRLVVQLNPSAVKNVNRVVGESFVHDLSTVLRGRRVVVTNSMGVFYQISYQPHASRLKSVDLNLDRQPSPYHVPLGYAGKEIWMPLSRFAPALIGGATGMGKSYLIHGVIMALLHGGKTEVYAWDGKQGREFRRYEGDSRMHHFLRFDQMVDALQTEINRRNMILAHAGAQSVEHYNSGVEPKDRIPPLLIVVDEAIFIDQTQTEPLRDFAARGRASGTFLIIGAQRPRADLIDPLITANLLTRISFHVPDHRTSQQILGVPGAETLPDMRARYMVYYNGRRVVVQAFDVTPPADRPPTLSQTAQPEPEPEPVESVSPKIAALAEKIRFAWGRGANDTELARIAGGRNAGAFHHDLRDAKAYLASQNSTTTTEDAHNDKNSAD